jgi:hypothetical protein
MEYAESVSSIFLFGGMGRMPDDYSAELTPMNDLWVLHIFPEDTSTWRWAQVAFSGLAPSPRTLAAMAVSAHTMFIVGGYGLKEESTNALQTPQLAEIANLDETGAADFHAPLEQKPSSNDTTAQADCQRSAGVKPEIPQDERTEKKLDSIPRTPDRGAEDLLNQDERSQSELAAETDNAEPGANEQQEDAVPVKEDAIHEEEDQEVAEDEDDDDDEETQEDDDEGVVEGFLG